MLQWNKKKDKFEVRNKSLNNQIYDERVDSLEWFCRFASGGMLLFMLFLLGMCMTS